MDDRYIYDGEGEVRVRSGGLGHFGVCAFGGMLSARTTHLFITPLDVLKVNMQANEWRGWHQMK